MRRRGVYVAACAVANILNILQILRKLRWSFCAMAEGSSCDEKNDDREISGARPDWLLSFRHHFKTSTYILQAICCRERSACSFSAMVGFSVGRIFGRGVGFLGR